MANGHSATHEANSIEAGGAGLTAVRAFCRELNIVASTHWRRERKGWIGPSLNIGGRKYHTQEQIAEFRRRAQAGEFAFSMKPGTKET
jgi:hypothetical protein